MVKWFSWLILLLFFSSCGPGWVPLEVDKTLGEEGNSEINNGDFEILDQQEYYNAYKILYNLRDQILKSGKLTHANDFEWDIHIIEDDSVLNAFCLPGGHIYIFTGLIRYLDSEAELAGVLGHEMAHADLRHSTGQLVQNLGLSLIIKLIFGGTESAIVNMGANLMSLSFSRGDESEADQKAVEYIYETELDASAATGFFKKIQNDEKDSHAPEFISSHPIPKNRIEKMQEKWKELGGKQGKLNRENYKILINALP